MQAARRYLTVLATSAMTQAKDGGAAGAPASSFPSKPWRAGQLVSCFYFFQ
jgi:hypothetical protein